MLRRSLQLLSRIMMPSAMSYSQLGIQERKQQIAKMPPLSAEDVREALLQYVSEHPCYGKEPAKNLVINNIHQMDAYHYKLETFTERRNICTRFVPYTGGQIDGPENGQAICPRDVLASPSALFAGEKRKMKVPHSTFVISCNRCDRIGKVCCYSCKGRGRYRCRACKGRGRISKPDCEQKQQCRPCEGTGINCCPWCRGMGQEKCRACDGAGRLKGFKELTITWTNHVDNYISETRNMPKELLHKVTGQTVSSGISPQLLAQLPPIMHTSDPALNIASEELIRKHSTANECILNQRHCLRLIPVSEVTYTWNGETGVFCVYGYEQKVYFRHYPQRFLFCIIMYKFVDLFKYVGF